MKPVEYYHSEQILAQERSLFDQCKYISHKMKIPELQDYWCVTQEKEARVLINTDKGHKLLSNICRHRQAKMLSGRGNSPSIVCPIHAWTYDLQGQNVSCPKWNIEQNRHLTTYELTDWNGFLFETNQTDLIQTLDQSRFSKYFKQENYAFHSEFEQICNFNWKTFMEVQADNLHVDFVHKGLGNWVDCEQQQYEWHKGFYVNSVPAKNNLRIAGSPAFEPWHKLIQPYIRDLQLDYGAIWLTIYPNIMIELHPLAIMTMTVHPITAQQTKLITEYYYPQDICWFDTELVKAHQQADLEITLQDIMIGERMDQGRLHLLEQRKNDIGPTHPEHEIGVKHFYQWYDAAMNIDPAAGE